ncbi:MAG: hypothetical protein ACXU9D_24535 [Xanthobacteraceae bacterium]
MTAVNAKSDVSRKDYDLIRVIYHASQGCETVRQYAADAEKENDKEAAGFFDKALELNEQLVQKGKELHKVKCSFIPRPSNAADGKAA